jgi:hypothetical protein
MKKIFLTLFILVSLITSCLSQDVVVTKSERMSFGKKDYSTGEMKYAPFENINEVFVIIEDRKITINSIRQQFYYLEPTSHDMNGCEKGSYWYASDNDDIKCIVYLYSNKYNEIFFSVEYSDYSWVYLLNPTQN